MPCDSNTAHERMIIGMSLRQGEVLQVLKLLEPLPQHSVTHPARQCNLLQSCMHIQTHIGDR